MKDYTIHNIKGRTIALRGDDIDTDRIIPARFLKELTFNNMGNYPFYDERFSSSNRSLNHPFNDPQRQGASLLICNKNFGCGSSREHAPQALYRWGIKGIIAESFAEIFAGNCLMIGLVPLTMERRFIEEIQTISEENPTVCFSINIDNQLLTLEKKKFSFLMPPATKKALLQGSWNGVHLLRQNRGRTERLAQNLPYLNHFSIASLKNKTVS